MKKFIATALLMITATTNTGCVSSSLYAAVKQLQQDDNNSHQVNEQALQQIQALRIQHATLSTSYTFSFAQKQSELAPQQKRRLEAILAKGNPKIVLHIAPASASTSFEQVLLATKRADQICQFVDPKAQSVEVHFAPQQTLDTLRIELGS